MYMYVLYVNSIIENVYFLLLFFRLSISNACKLILQPRPLSVKYQTSNNIHTYIHTCKERWRNKSLDVTHARMVCQWSKLWWKMKVQNKYFPRWTRRTRIWFNISFSFFTFPCQISFIQVNTFIYFLLNFHKSMLDLQ